ncbi:MAG: hypothetical protein JNL01_15595 [Bdellovibrionales bacterium]|nr:hypothetical protein [Bdellovibrionales bacterium]
MSFQTEGVAIQKYQWNTPWKWMREALKTAHHHFLFLWGYVIVAILVKLVLGFVPVVGSALAEILQIILVGGLMVVVQGWEKGEVSRFSKVFGYFDDFEKLKTGAGNLIILGVINLSFAVVGIAMAGVGIKAEEIKEISDRLAAMDQQTLTLVAVGFLWLIVGSLIAWFAMIGFLLQMKYRISLRASLELAVSNGTHNIGPYLMTIATGMVMVVGTILTLGIGGLWVFPATQIFLYQVVRDGFKNA